MDEIVNDRVADIVDLKVVVDLVVILRMVRYPQLQVQDQLELLNLWVQVAVQVQRDPSRCSDC